MSAAAELLIPDNPTIFEEPAVEDVFAVEVNFDRWLHALRGPLSSADPAPDEEPEGSGIYIGSFPGSKCDLSFEGVLHFDGYSFGNINSPEGTLILTRRGRIEADINVGVAVINGSVTGNITATERVVLESDAKVTGDIFTPALSIRLGAVFDGDCMLTRPQEVSPSELCISEEEAAEMESLLVGV